jgi:hypothetical protein
MYFSVRELDTTELNKREFSDLIDQITATHVIKK